MTILTLIKKTFNAMTRFLAVPKVWGLLTTVIFTLIYHYGSVIFNYTPAVGWVWLFLVLGVFIAGLRVGLLCALWVSAYSYYVAVDNSLLVQRVIISFAMAGLVGWQTRQLRMIYQASDSLLNGNAVKLNEALQFLREAKDELFKAKQKIELGEDRLGNVLATVVGYKALRGMIQEIEAWHADPANIQKARDMPEEE